MGAAARVQVVDPAVCPEVKAIDPDALALVAAAIEESGLQRKVIALALGVDPAYLSRMLTGEKPWPIQKLDMLPAEVRRAYARMQAEREGWQVVEETRHRHLIRRVIGELLVELASDCDPRLPMRAGVPLKASLR